MFNVLSEKLKTKILNGSIKNGFMVKVIGEKDQDRIFFETELDTEEYMRELTKEDITKRFLVQTVTLHEQIKI